MKVTLLGFPEQNQPGRWRLPGLPLARQSVNERKVASGGSGLCSASEAPWQPRARTCLQRLGGVQEETFKRGGGVWSAFGSGELSFKFSGGKKSPILD